MPFFARPTAILCIFLVALSVNACASARPTLKIGLIAPFEGVQRPQGYAVLNAVKLALAQHNQNADAHRYGIELVALNDDGKPATAARQLRALAADPDVIGFIGGWQTNTAMALAQENKSVKLPGIVPAALPDDELSASQNLFRLFASDATIANAVKAQIPTEARVRLLGTPVGWAASFANATVDEKASDNTTEAVIFAGDAENVARELPTIDCHSTRRVCIAGPDTNFELIEQRAKNAARSLKTVSLLPKLDCNTQKEFCDAYKKLAGNEPNDQAVLAFDATRVLLDAVERAAKQGPPTRMTTQDMLTSTRYAGLAGTVAFDATRTWVTDFFAVQ